MVPQVTTNVQALGCAAPSIFLTCVAERLRNKVNPARRPHRATLEIVHNLAQRWTRNYAECHRCASLCVEVVRANSPVITARWRTCQAHITTAQSIPKTSCGGNLHDIGAIQGAPCCVFYGAGGRENAIQRARRRPRSLAARRRTLIRSGARVEGSELRRGAGEASTCERRQARRLSGREQAEPRGWRGVRMTRGPCPLRRGPALPGGVRVQSRELAASGHGGDRGVDLRR